MKKDISKLLDLLRRFRDKPDKIELKDEIFVELNEFFAQKTKPLEDVKKIDDVFSEIPDDQFVVDRLLVNLELKNEKRILHYKKLFVSKYGGKLIGDENYSNLTYIATFLSLLPVSIAHELTDNVIYFLRKNPVKDSYIPFLEGYKPFIEKKYKSAIEKFDEVTAIDNNCWYTFLLIAYSYFARKEYRIAIGYFNKTLDFTENIKSYSFDILYSDIAYNYFQINDYENTVKFLSKSLKINPKLQYANNLMGYSLYRLKRYEEAVIYLDKSIKLDPDGQYPYWNKLRVFKAIGEYDKALEIIKILKGISKSKKTIEREIETIKKLKSKRKPLKKDLKETVFVEDEVELNEGKFYPAPAKAGDSDIEFQKEEILERFLENRLLKKKKTFGKYLKIYDDGYYGRQYRTDTGRMDILTQDLKDNSFVIIELKRGISDTEVVDQIQDYIDWTKKNLAKKDQPVKGIICIKEATNSLNALVKTLPDIELYEYEFNFIKKA